MRENIAGAGRRRFADGEPPPPFAEAANGPPPRAGEEFRACASRLAGFAGAFLGWAPEVFWRATPAELLAVVSALRGEDEAVPPDGATMLRLREAFPDG